jgi:hypothetical protein
MRNTSVAIMALAVAGMASGARAGLPDFFVLGEERGLMPALYVYDGQGNIIVATIVPYNDVAFAPGSQGGVRVATGDIDGDGIADIITGPGPGAGPIVRVFAGSNGARVRDFFAFEPAQTSGVFVAGGDVTGDGRDDIIVGEGGGPRVRVFDGVNGSQVRDFFAFEPNFTGGVRVATGNIVGTPVDEIIAGPGPGRDAQVRVFDINNAPVREFQAFTPTRNDGIFVGAGDFNQDTWDDVVVGSSEVRMFQVFNTATQLPAFVTLPPTPGGVQGVTVSAGDVNGDGRDDFIYGEGPSPRGVRSGVFAFAIQSFGSGPTDVQATVGVQFFPQLQGPGGVVVGGATTGRFGAPLPCDPIDFNGDGVFPDLADIVELFFVYAGGACTTGACGDIDFNNDGIFPDLQDVIIFLFVYGGGPC